MTSQLRQWLDNPPTTMAEKAKILKQNKQLLSSQGQKGEFLRQLLREVEEQHDLMSRRAKELDPLMFAKPSFEQMLMLNSWMYGISWIGVYSANRIGKTTACWWNIQLWLFPNNPKWRIFQPYRIGETGDEENAHNPRAHSLVQVFTRPDISSIKKIADALLKRPPEIPAPDPLKPHYHPNNVKVLQWLQLQVPSAYRRAWPKQPWDKGGAIWFGAPDQQHHEKVIMPLIKEWLPENAIMRYVPSEREITIKCTSPSGHDTVWEWIGKSYESKDTKWSSGAVDIIALTEGVTPDTFKEVKLRFKDPGIGSHDFTPYLPANSGAASALAQRIYKGVEVLPLKSFVFTQFSVYNAPVHILSKDKQQGLINSFKNDPQGIARLEGKFYSSSALVLANFSRENNLIDMDRKQFFATFANCRLYRGVDPGLDHPTSCAWGALLPTNQLVIYRMMSEPGLSIQQRCKRIIELSGNRIGIHKWGPGQNDFYCYEANSTPQSELFSATYCDYHTFKEDEVTGLPYALNYQLAGLNIQESIHTGPEERAQLVDDHLRLSPFLPNLITRRPKGPRLMFLKNEPGIIEVAARWEEFYWGRKKSGEDRGAPTDKIPSHGDDELDAVSYIDCAPIVWTRFQPSARLEGDSEPELELIEASQNIQRRGHSSLQSLQNVQQQTVIFGQIEYDDDSAND